MAFESTGGPFRGVTRAAGERIQAEGDTVEKLWLVQSGRVALSRSSADGVRHVCGSRGAGAAIGLEGLSGIAGQRDAVVVEDARFMCARVSELLEETASHAATLMHLASEEVARCVTENSLSQGAAILRTARFLRSREEDPLMAGWAGARLFEVACLLNIRPETLSRALRDLEERGLIHDGRSPRIVDRAGVSRLLAGH